MNLFFGVDKLQKEISMVGRFSFNFRRMKRQFLSLKKNWTAGDLCRIFISWMFFYYFLLLVSFIFFIFYDTSLLVEVFKGNTHFVYLFGNNNATRIRPFSATQNIIIRMWKLNYFYKISTIESHFESIRTMKIYKTAFHHMHSLYMISIFFSKKQ